LIGVVEESKMADMRNRHKNSQPDAKDRRIAELEEQLEQALLIIKKQQRQIERLQQMNEELRERVAELERAVRRQANPFARRQLVAKPKRPGRKRGRGRFVHREMPEIHQVHETRVERLPACPECGGKVREIHRHEQYVTDIPVVEVKTTRYVTYSGYCPACHRRVRSHHPEQISGATGAAGVLVGPRAKALAANLKHRLGVSYGKVGEVMNDTFGLRVSRSGWCQADQKLACKARPVYAELVEAIRQSSVVHADETGWRIGTLAAWLWVFTQQEASVYVIRDTRGSEVVLDILGKEFRGILSSDCFVAYEDRRLKAWLKQKCVSHLLRELSVFKEIKSGRALHFARQVTLLLQDAIRLKAEKASLDPFTFHQHARALETRLDVLIAPKRRFSDQDNKRFAKRLRKYRSHLLRFLYVDELDATNNLAERMLRPAVITRKTNGCNRNRKGAEAHAILASVLVTCHQQSIPVLDYLVQLQQFGGTPLPLLPQSIPVSPSIGR